MKKIIELLLVSKRKSKREKMLIKIRDIIAKYYDGEVSLNTKEGKFFFNFSHRLLVEQKLFPNYDKELRKIGLYIKSKKQKLNMLDIGANIGDTVRNTGIKDGSYLLVEGEKKFISYIEKNLKGYSYKLEKVFLGDNESIENGTTKCIRTNGTSKLVKTKEKNNIKITTLDKLIKQNKEFKPNFIKIDTDGFDFKVLRGAKKTLEFYKPALYFEWDKFLLEEQDEKPVEIFEMLYELGYLEGLIYDNFGNLLLKLNLKDDINLSLLMNYTKNSDKNIYYYDVLLFNKESKFLDINEYLEFRINKYN